MMKKNNNRRSFLKELSLIGAGSLLWSKDATANPLITQQQKGDFSFLTSPILQTPEADGITISWLSSGPAVAWVEYGTHELTEKEFAYKSGMIMANNHIHHIKLRGLKAGKEYKYRVFCKAIERYNFAIPVFGETIQSEVSSFQLPDKAAKKVSITVMNDIHNRGAITIPALMQIADKNPDYVFFNGDMFDAILNEEQLIEGLINPISTAFGTHTPALFSKGNHEVRGGMARSWDDYFLPTAGEAYHSIG